MSSSALDISFLFKVIKTVMKCHPPKDATLEGCPCRPLQKHLPRGLLLVLLGVQMAQV